MITVRVTVPEWWEAGTGFRLKTDVKRRVRSRGAGTLKDTAYRASQAEVIGAELCGLCELPCAADITISVTEGRVTSEGCVEAFTDATAEAVTEATARATLAAEQFARQFVHASCTATYRQTVAISFK